MNNYQYEVVSSGSQDENKSKYKPLRRQLLVTSPAWIILFSTGIAFGATTVFIPQIRREANSTEAISDEMASWLSSVFSYSAIPAVLIICSLMPIVGRKILFIILSLNTLTFNLVLYFSTNTTHLLIAEIMQGFNHAANLSLTIIILSEYTSPKYRGIFLTIKSATFYWGVWCANTIGTFYHWKYIPLFGIIVTSYTLIAFFWPESPQWLASRGRFEECAKSYFWLMGKNETTKKELERLIESQKEDIKNRQRITITKIIEMIKSRSFYKPTFVCLTMMLQYNLTGKIVCAMYAITIIKQITGSESAAYYGMLLLDGVTVAGMYCGCFLSRVVKRRTLLFTMGGLSIIFLLILSLYLYLIKLEVINEDRYATACLLVGFSLAVGMGPIIMLISIHGELTPMKYKSFCMMLASLFYNIVSGILLKLAPFIFATFGMHGTFFFYGVSSGSCLVLLYFHLPETKDKTLQEIAEMFEEKKHKTLF